MTTRAPGDVAQLLVTERARQSMRKVGNLTSVAGRIEGSPFVSQ